MGCTRQSAKDAKERNTEILSPKPRRVVAGVRGRLTRLLSVFEVFAGLRQYAFFLLSACLHISQPAAARMLYAYARCRLGEPGEPLPTTERRALEKAYALFGGLGFNV